MHDSPEFGGRRHTRIGYKEGRAVVRSRRSGPSTSGTLMDLSISGCLLLMDEPLAVSASEVIEVRLDLRSMGFRVMGFVRHASQNNHAIGIEFHRMSEDDTADLMAFIEFFHQE